MKIRKRVELLPAQLELCTDRTSPFIVMSAGLGAGKTDGLIYKALDTVSLIPPARDILFVGLSYAQLSDVVIPSMATKLDDLKIKHKWEEGRKRFVFWDDRKILMRSGDRPDSIQSLNCASVLIDETALQKPALVKKVVMRSARFRSDIMQVVYSGTPEGANHYYDIAHMRGEYANRPVRWIKARTVDNCFLPPDYVQKNFSHLSEQDRRQYLEGEFIIKGGRVYHILDRALTLSTCDEPLSGEQILLCDFNRTKMCWISAVHRRGVIHCYHEHVRQNVTTHMHGDDVASWYRQQGVPPSSVRLFMDATGSMDRSYSTSTDLSILREIGFNVAYSGKSNPRREDRINSVNEALRKGTLRVDPAGCPYLVDCLSQQARNERGEPERGRWDHGADAVGYGVHALYPALSARDITVERYQ